MGITNIEKKQLKIKKFKKHLKKKAKNIEKKRGLIYIGHLPHGFYENEIQSYFNQFGKVTRVKVCRSPKTGNCKGYGFVEFKLKDVAKIAATTMHNYLFFNKRLICAYVPYSERPKYLFRGRVSTKVHNTAMDRRGRLKHARNRELDEQTVTMRINKVCKKLEQKANKLIQKNILCTVKPVDGNMVESQSEETTFIELDSDVDIRITK